MDPTPPRQAKEIHITGLMSSLILNTHSTDGSAYKLNARDVPDPVLVGQISGHFF